MVSAVAHRQPAVPEPGLTAAARTLRAAPPAGPAPTGAAQVLLREWLDRLASDR
jgi:hypothetical protein